jgi:hypothetical protein
MRASAPAFTQGALGMMSGNNLECRSYHAGAAAGGGAMTHCPHAGPAGDAVCGDNCESFCTIALAKCPTQYPTMNACTTACAGFAMNTARYNSTSTSGNSFACRMYHLSVAAIGAGSAATHCPHTQTTSATCQ